MFFDPTMYYRGYLDSRSTSHVYVDRTNTYKGLVDPNITSHVYAGPHKYYSGYVDLGGFSSRFLINLTQLDKHVDKKLSIWGHLTYNFSKS